MRDAPEPVADVGFVEFLGRDARSGSWSDLGSGTYRVALDSVAAGHGQRAAELLRVAVLEAEELHDVYGRWPLMMVEWLRARGVDAAALAEQIARLRNLVGGDAVDGFEAGWVEYLRLTDRAIAACRDGSGDAGSLIELTRSHWQRVHDGAVDHVYGLLDISVRLLDEGVLVDIWNHLMDEWYDAHERRLDIDRQPWEESARQLRLAIVDGFHAHLTGPDRLGDVEVFEEEDRWSFRFAPCGSGGRTMSDAASAGSPRPGPPYDFATTTDEHDWAWNTKGICAYCVHCCLLNEVVPIDRLGYPTRVIDPPVWPDDRQDPRCTWSVYKDPSLVPDWVYERVGRDPTRRPGPPDSGRSRTRST